MQNEDTNLGTRVEEGGEPEGQSQTHTPSPLSINGSFSKKNPMLRLKNRKPGKLKDFLDWELSSQ